MKNSCSRVLFVSISLLSIFGAVVAQKATIAFATEEDLKAQVAMAPCKDKERLEAVRDLFVKMGAKETEVTVEKFKNVENVMVAKKGKSEGIIVVGAHYDKTPDGCGAIDNWTGIVLLANLYRTLKDFNTDKTYLFVAFGREEEGLIGSDAMADAIPKEKRTAYCAMVNFDSFGFSYPQALRNISDTSLIKLAEEVSKEMKVPFAQAGIELASSDSASFRRKDIPAITLHGLNNDWQKYLHSSSDKISSVNSQSVYIGYRHGLVLLSKIDQKPCEAFRK